MGPPASSSGGGLAGLVSHQGVQSIEKTLQWKLLFFGGACVTFAAGVIAVICWILKFTWAPFTFMTECFLLFLGALMMVLDFPMPHPSPALTAVRDNAYKFVLFMTRFTGRGMWYLFLSTMVFSALSDNPINYFLGVVGTLYLCLLGLGALIKGWMISSKLNSVRTAIKGSGRTAEYYIPKGSNSMSKEMFKAMVESVTNQRDLFTNDELDYVINALAFTPYNDGSVTLDEFEYWLRESSVMLMV